MKVIKFPAAVNQHQQPKSKNLNVLMRSAAFTCTECGMIAYLKTEGMVFRMIDFYCDGCGQNHKIVNPAFVLAKGTR